MVVYQSEGATNSKPPVARQSQMTVYGGETGDTDRGVNDAMIISLVVQGPEVLGVMENTATPVKNKNVALVMVVSEANVVELNVVDFSAAGDCIAVLQYLIQ